jgi:excisionase family DNA binding protein
MQSEQLRAAWDAIRDAGAEQLPELIGQLESLKAQAWARLTAQPAAVPQRDELLDVEQAAGRLSVSKDYLYRNAKSFPFTKRMGRKLLFSSNGIDQYLSRKR